MAVKLLEVPLKAPVCVKLPEPPKVRPKPAPVIAGKLKEALLAALKVAALVKVIVPLKTLAVEAEVAIAPALLTPVPATEIVLPRGKDAPFNNNSPPELMMMPAVPSALLLLASTIPPELMLVPPL